MRRGICLGVLCVLLAGCGGPEGAREVPVSKRTDAAAPTGGDGPTKPARAIATH